MSGLYGVEDLPAQGLSEVAALARELSRQKDALAAKQAELNAIEESIGKIECEALPAALRELGVKTLTLENGELISLKDELGVGVTDANRIEAYNWLRANGAGSLIKRVVAISFGKGEDDIASEVFAQLREAHSDNPVVDKADVHYQTLKSFVKERLATEKELQEAGAVIPEPLPRVLFGVFEQQRAVIKRPKQES